MANKRSKAARAPTAAVQEIGLGDGPLFSSDAEPELGAVLKDILHSLRQAESVAITVGHALAGLNADGADEAEATLRRGCSDELTEQIGLLERAIEGARLRGSKMVVVAARAQDVAHG